MKRRIVGSAFSTRRKLPTRRFRGVASALRALLALPFFLSLIPTHATAREVYTVRFIASGPLIDPPCRFLNWHDHLLFHNTAAQDAVVRLLGVSNGSRRSEATDLIVPAGRSRSVVGIAQDWYPNTNTETSLWVNRLDVPDGVLLTSRLQARVSVGSPCPPVSDTRGVGATGLPIFSSLRPPSEPQYHLGTDLGPDATGYAANARINVGIYNAGSSPATATIEVHRGCDERLMDARTVTIPSDSIQQVLALSTRTGIDCPGVPVTTAIYSTYVVVRVDQPSFSYAVTLSNEMPPQIPIGVSFTR
ncbi:MAG: hypothetical protein ACRD3M_10690 [Thermoanaerobaculia bacterium]